MQIRVQQENLSPYGLGGGTRTSSCDIVIDGTRHPREQRRILLYETLGCILGYCLTHEQIDDVADVIADALDQLEPL